jgi:putative ABC transport system ATP-binding protein
MSHRPATPPSTLRLDDVHLTLASAAGQVNILRGIDLSIDGGETVGVIGPSGSGKTSMLMVIAGLEQPTKGRVHAAGVDLTALDEDGLALFRRDHIGIVFQNFHLVPTMTALENVAIPLEFAGRSDAFEAARASLERVGLGHRVTHYPSQLSGGEQQRVALARAFVAEPAILLADEPTGNLDRATGESVMDALFDLQKRCNTTLVLVTHEPELTHRCTRVIHLADGRIVGDEAVPAARAATPGRP